MQDTDDQSEQVEATPAPPPKRRRRVARWVAVLLVLPVALLVLAVVLLINRPLPAPEWVVADIEERAEALLAGGRVDVGEITLVLGRDLHPRVQIRDARIRDAAGAPLARIPQVEGLFSPRGLAFERELLLQDLSITGAQLSLRRAADGAVALSFEPGASEVEEATTFLDLLDQSDAFFDQAPFVALETIRADGVIVNYTDVRAGRAWTVDGGAMMLDLRDAKTRLSGDFSVLSGGAGVTSLAATYESPRNSSEAALTVSITDASARDIAAQSPALSWLAGIDAPLSAELTTGRNPDGTFAPLIATLDLGQGALQPNAATAPITFESAGFALEYDPGGNVISFRDIRVAGELGTLRGEGQALLGMQQGGLPQSLVGQIRLRDSRLRPPGLSGDGVAIPQAQIDLKLDLAPFVLTLGDVWAQLDAFELRGAGSLAAADTGWDAAFDLSIPAVEHNALLALWPADMVKPVRDWAAEAIGQARYADMHMALRKPSDAPLQVAGSFGYADMQLTYLNSMPPIAQAKGTGTFTQDVFAITLDQGGVTAPTGDWVTLDASTMIIPDLHAPFRPATYDLRMQAATPALLSLLDLPPMGYMTKAGLPVDVTGGQAQVRMALSHPMKRSMTGDEVGFSATATLRGVDTLRLIPDRRLRADRLQLDIDKSGMEITGNAQVDGVPLRATYRHQFTGEGGGRLQGRARVTEARLQTFGIALPPGSVGGEGDVTLDLRFPRDGPPRYSVTSDLVGLTVAIPAVGWAKPPGTPGALTVEGRLGPDQAVEALSIAGGGLNVRGDVTFTDAGGLERARLSQVQIGNWLNAPITLRGRGAGRAPSVIIGGGVIDLRRASFGSGDAEGGPISIALDRLQITEGIVLNQFAGEFTSAGGFSGQFEARLNNAAAIRGTVAPRNGRSAVRIVSDNAGDVARAAGLMRNGVGGALDLTLLPTGGDGVFDGRLAIRDLRVRDAPTIAALLDAISVIGLLQQLDGQGIAFDAVDARFRVTPQQVILAEASAVGPGLGISLDGIYTLASQQLDFQGVVSPLYLINSIGSILTRQGEGLIGFNFNVAGTTAQPAVSVNPLSVFTPGMFREIFRREPPQVSQ